MSIILWIIGGLIALAVAFFLLKLVMTLLGLSLLLGGLSWLIFDTFWAGAVLGGIMTIIWIIRDPDSFWDNVAEWGNTPSGSSSSSSPDEPKQYIRTPEGNVEIYSNYAGGFIDVNGHKWEEQLDGSYRRIS